MIAWLIYLAILWYAFDFGMPKLPSIPKVVKMSAVLVFSYYVFFYIGR